MMNEIQFENGAELVTYHSEHALSFSIGFFTLAGLADEPVGRNGIAHFLEHMSFKGTATKSARQIASLVDDMGGKINAFTSKEYTCYYLTVLPSHATRAFNILYDLFFNSTVTEHDLTLERNVILEEIKMYDDTPDESIHDLFTQTIWGNSPLGRPIIGTEASLADIDRAALLKFKELYFDPKRLVVAVAGNLLKYDKLVAYIRSELGKVRAPESLQSKKPDEPSSRAFAGITHKDSEQVHLCLGAPGLSYSHPDHFKLAILSTLLGGSMSSRLFQEIREKKGYAYSVYTYLSFYRSAGLFTVYAGVSKSKLTPTIRIILNEFDKLCQKRISAKELSKAKEYMKGNMFLGLERSASWMVWMGKEKLYLGHVEKIADMIRSIDAVTAEDVQLISQRTLAQSQLAFSAIGPVSSKYLSANDQTFDSFLNTVGIKKRA